MRLFALIHVSSVWPSHAAACGAFHGASTGTEVDIESSFETTVARSSRIVGSGGALPVGPVSL